MRPVEVWTRNSKNVPREKVAVKFFIKLNLKLLKL